MKKILFPAILTMPLTAVILMACQSAPQQQPSNAAYAPSAAAAEVPKATGASRNDWEIIDDKGATMGVPAPGWITYAISDDIAALKRDPRFEDKTVFVFTGAGQDLDLTRSWVNNFNASGEISRQISTKVNAKFEGGLQGTNNTGKLQKLKEVVASLSRTRVSGLAREMDWWTLRRNKTSGQEQYQYIVVYSISKNDLRHQIDAALGKIAARAAEEKELMDDMHKALGELEFDEMVDTRS